MRFKNAPNNIEISNLIFEYLRLNNTDELMEHDPELFDWNHWDIIGYQETFDEMDEEEEWTDKEVTHLRGRVEAMKTYIEGLRKLNEFYHVYS